MDNERDRDPIVDPDRDPLLVAIPRTGGDHANG